MEKNRKNGAAFGACMCDARHHGLSRRRKRKLDSSGMSIIDRKSGASYRYMPAYIGPRGKVEKSIRQRNDIRCKAGSLYDKRT